MSAKISKMEQVLGLTGQEQIEVVRPDASGELVNMKTTVSQLRDELGITLKGKLDSYYDLPPAEEMSENDTYSIHGYFWSIIDGQWENIGYFKGEQGDSGVGLQLLGELSNTEFLPEFNNTIGDAWIINKEMWVWEGDHWAPVGQVGPEGRSAYQLAVDTGMVDPTITLPEWLASLKGDSAFRLAKDAGAIPSDWTLSQYLDSLHGTDGLTAFQIAQQQNPALENVNQWLASLVGPRGPKGDQGEEGPQGQPANAIKVLGKVNAGSDLARIDDPAPGDGYFVNQNLFVWNGEEWIDVGQVVGPQGEQGVEGPEGPQGPQGDVGASLYDLAVEQGYTGTLNEYLDEIQGEDGRSAYQIAYDLDDTIGSEAEWVASLQGVDGLDPYEAAVEKYGFTGTYEEWMETLRGPKGDKGQQGPRGNTGRDLEVLGRFDTVDELPDLAATSDAYIVGRNLYIYLDGAWFDAGPFEGSSAYDIAVRNGFEGTEEEWLESLRGQGIYQFAVAQGFEGTEEEFLASLQGPQGETGEVGPRGLRGERGDLGPGVTILGRYDDPSELPSVGNLGDTWLIQGDAWVWSGQQFENMGPIQGPRGDSGESVYDVALRNGFEGSEDEFLTSLKGADGTAINIKGVRQSQLDLPQYPARGDAYMIGANFWFYDGDQWVNGGAIKGPAGERGPQGPKGDQGPQGIQGDQGTAVTIVGEYTDESQLPLQGERGDGFLIAGHLFVWQGDEWRDVGEIKGPKGDKGDTGEQGVQGERGIGIHGLGELDSVDDLPDPSDVNEDEYYLIEGAVWLMREGSWAYFANLRGPDGYSAYELAKQRNPALQNEAEWLASLQGPQGEVGPEGPQGTAIRPRGELEDTSELQDITEPGQGDAYLVAGDLWVYDEGWVLFGTVQGPEGAEGPMGPGISILGRLNSQSELPASANPGEGYLIGLDFWGWTGSGDWENLGAIRGPQGEKGDTGDEGPQGPKGDRGEKGEKGDIGTRWLTLEEDPKVVNGMQGDYAINTNTNEYFYKATVNTWVSIGHFGGGNVWDAQHDGRSYVRKDGEWVELEVQNPEDEGRYVRTQEGWERFNTYDLLITQVDTDVKDHVFDVSQCQAYVVDGSKDINITITNAPADRATALTVTFNGDGGIIQWPEDIHWNYLEAPVLDDTFTLVVLWWDGTRWTGAIAANG